MTEPKITTRRHFNDWGTWVAQWMPDLETCMWGVGRTEEEAVMDLRAQMAKAEGLPAEDEEDC